MVLDSTRRVAAIGTAQTMGLAHSGKPVMSSNSLAFSNPCDSRAIFISFRTYAPIQFDHAARAGWSRRQCTASSLALRSQFRAGLLPADSKAAAARTQAVGDARNGSGGRHACKHGVTPLAAFCNAPCIPARPKVAARMQLAPLDHGTRRRTRRRTRRCTRRHTAAARR
jgi:hypothetical protein